MCSERVAHVDWADLPWYLIKGANKNIKASRHNEINIVKGLNTCVLLEYSNLIKLADDYWGIISQDPIFKHKTSWIYGDMLFAF